MNGETKLRDLIRLSIAAGKLPGIKSVEDFAHHLARTLNTSVEYVNRIINGTRPLRGDGRRLVAELLCVTEVDLDLSLFEFATRVGVSRTEASRLLGQPINGLDFSSRTSDPRTIRQTFALIHGYWESFYWSVSKISERAVSRDLCIVEEIDDYNFINCRVIDAHFHYVGKCFPMQGHLYFFLEKDRLFNEIIVYATNRPERERPVLRGIILCMSGGVDEIYSYPCASKVVFRFIGLTPDEVRLFYPAAPQQEAALRTYLIKEVPRYMPFTEIMSQGFDPDTRHLIDTIDNTISADSVPFALRVTK